MPVYDAQTKSQYLQAISEAKVQEKKTNDAARVYKAAADKLALLYEENGFEAPAKTAKEFPPYQKALRDKQTAFVAWQKECYKHGAMFVDMQPPAQAVTGTGEGEDRIW